MVVDIVGIIRLDICLPGTRIAFVRYTGYVKLQIPKRLPRVRFCRIQRMAFELRKHV